jgi:hypothetical protein
MYGIVYLCVLIVFLLHQESHKLILIDEPHPRGHSIIDEIRANSRQHTEVLKNG